MINYWKLFISEVTPGTVIDLINFIFPIVVERKENATINLYISSVGGDIDSAIRFYDFIKGSKAKVNTFGFGQIDSSAVLLFMAGSKRVVLKNSRLRLHSPNYNATHNSQHISIVEETSKFLSSIDKRYFQIISNEMGISENKARSMYGKGLILSPEKAVELKIATEMSSELSYPIAKENG